MSISDFCNSCTKCRYNMIYSMYIHIYMYVCIYVYINMYCIKTVYRTFALLPLIVFLIFLWGIDGCRPGNFCRFLSLFPPHPMAVAERRDFASLRCWVGLLDEAGGDFYRFNCFDLEVRKTNRTPGKSDAIVFYGWKWVTFSTLKLWVSIFVRSKLQVFIEGGTNETQQLWNQCLLINSLQKDVILQHSKVTNFKG